MSQSVLRLRDHDTAVKYEGEILFEGEDLLKKPLGEMMEYQRKQDIYYFPGSSDQLKSRIYHW